MKLVGRPHAGPPARTGLQLALRIVVVVLVLWAVFTVVGYLIGSSSIS